jgi:hypothetical protein
MSRNLENDVLARRTQIGSERVTCETGENQHDSDDQLTPSVLAKRTQFALRVGVDLPKSAGFWRNEPNFVLGVGNRSKQGRRYCQADCVVRRFSRRKFAIRELDAARNQEGKT